LNRSGTTSKLQKVLAQAGLGSRREMEQWVRAGRVTVNAEPAHIGARVGPDDVIQVDGRPVRGAGAARTPRVLLYHKPEGEIVSRDDPAGRASVFERVPPVRGAQWLAVGRLDYNTCGLLILTTDGEVANRMMHPRYGLEREYAVRVRGKLSAAQVARLRSGIDLDDGPAQCDAVEDAGGEGTNHWYRIVIREGRNRVVRRLFDALGLVVSRLMRVRFGPLALPPRLKRGQYVELPPQEVRELLTSLGLGRPLAGRDSPGNRHDRVPRARQETRSRPRRFRAR
jgi:23S rRNA pseudouridine2605 synthase